ncbi:MAG TPA: hypothetical protein P5026_05470 [Kiritimatiellia bacterium]|nr:hypothetical protein [Kiritimatiellia bacterium]
MDIWIKIRSLFDKQAVDDAAKGVEDVGKKTEAVGEAARGAQGNTDKAFSAINASAQVAEGGVAGVGNAVRTLAGQFPALNAAIAPVGLALAAFAAWKKAVDAVKESRESLAKGKFDTIMGNEEAGIRSLSAAYERLRKSIADTEDARRRLSDAEASKDDAQTAAELAALDLESAQRQARLDPADQFAQRRLDIEMSRKRAEIVDASAARRLERDKSDALASAAFFDAQKKAAEETAAAQEDTFRRLYSQYNARNNRMDREMDAAWTPDGRTIIGMKGEKDLARIATAMTSAYDKLTAALEEAAQAEREKNTALAKAEVSSMNRQTLPLSVQTAEIRRKMDMESIERDAAAERERLQLRMRELMDRQADVAGRGGDLRARKAAESADVDRVRRTGKGNLEKEQKEFEAAAKALADYAERSTRVLADLRADMAKVKEALKNLPNN